jgi:hypothetical protein
MINRLQYRLWTSAILCLAAIVLAGCGLFGASERERQNEEVTQGIELGEVVTAEGISNNNAPVNETDNFDSSQDYIYVVAEAEFIEEGTTLFARWYRNDEPFEDSLEITADRDYRDTYIEFHLENLQNNFEEGEYRVEILANGNPVGNANFEVN